MDKNLNPRFPVEIFETLPEFLKPSGFIDFLLFLGALKPSLRVAVVQQQERMKLENWCSEHDFASVSSDVGYVYVAHEQKMAQRLQDVDDDPEPHEYELGLLLGYPECCCRHVAGIGEFNIDKWESDLSHSVKYGGRFELIDPCGYSEGYSLISHIPCSTACNPSLSIAEAALQIVLHHKTSLQFHRWRRWMSTSCST